LVLFQNDSIHRSVDFHSRIIGESVDNLNDKIGKLLNNKDTLADLFDMTL